ncbi:dolichyl-phosphate beta-glucosyltransferase [Gimesia maris]|uniref:dolichyl-phosphate beta-glucosyltransferase n=1 Tax=Gimesia maris TaxID=122 RepID=UPI0030DAACC4|tara:strand:+ start:9767 stop:10546 length:780 start_codon:yes stop_codon:yes gene_type:complete
MKKNSQIEQPTANTQSVYNHSEETHSLLLSLIIPAYNEMDRLPSYLMSIKSYFLNKYSDNYEIIIVDDGSSDGLKEKVTEIQQSWPQIKYIRHSSNQGKGAAVRTGMKNAEGKYLLFTDADGATDIEHEEQFRKSIDSGADIVIGSRLLKSSVMTQKRTIIRKVIAKLFSTIVNLVTSLDLKDTQCGFKMFRRDVGQRLFDSSTNNGYLFDIEILLKAKSLGCNILVLPVNWSDIPGSKVRIIVDSAVMLKDLFFINKS